jgi:hypothetical protein
MAQGRLPEQTNPAKPLDGWSVSDVIAEMQAAMNDAGTFLAAMDKAEKTRLCDRPGKNGTGRKADTAKENAKPWHGAADHDVFLTHWLIKLRTAMRLAALRRGSFSVRAMEGTDARKAQLLRLVMLYYMQGAMGTMIPVHGCRAGAWSDRYGHSLLYVTWKRERAVETRTVTKAQLVELAMQSNLQEAGAAGASPEAMQIIAQVSEADFEARVMSKSEEGAVAQLLLQLDPGLRQRGAEGRKEALRVVRAMRAGEDTVTYVTSITLADHPVWESLIPFVDVFYPAETVFEDNLDSARWIARTKWLSVQQIREQAAIHGWNQQWVLQVITKRGRQQIFNTRTRGWVMGGAGVGWSVNGGRANGESERNLIQILEVWDRSTTPDGLRGTYHTVMHADVPGLVAKRELLPHWSGKYPFVPVTHEMDERMLLANRGVPHFTQTPQQAIEAQWNSRTDAASLSTVPPWTGPPELRGTRIQPGGFVEAWRTGEVEAFKLPPPDNRSVEVERTIRGFVNQLYGVPSNDVPDSVSMLMGQSDMDWFLMPISQALQLTAKLVQQFMPTLTGARITGTDIVFNASPDEVRGSFDFLMKFDVRALDVEWTKELLTFVKDLLVPLARPGQLNTKPLLEFGFSVLDPSLSAESIMPDDMAAQNTTSKGKGMMDSIFSGGDGNEPAPNGEDYAGIAKTMMDEFTKSPARQRMFQTVPQYRAVFLARVRQLIDLDKQYGENAQIGRQQGASPLQPPSEIEQFLEQLEAEAEQADAMMQQMQPQPQSP